MRIVVAITGASGVIYAIRLLEELRKVDDVETHLIISKVGKDIIKHETNYSLDNVIELGDYYYEEDDLTSKINSGSFYYDYTIVIPCSMKTLGSISCGFADNTITRACDVTLKENRQLIIVPRETPLRSVHLENMLKLSREGAIILPAMPAFYHKPESIEQQVDFIVGKIFDILKINNKLFTKWKQ